MAKMGSGKTQMKRQQQKQWNQTVKSLKSAGKIFGIGKKKKRKKSFLGLFKF